MPGSFWYSYNCKVFLNRCGLQLIVYYRGQVARSSTTRREDNRAMICGHCKVSFHHNEQAKPFIEDKNHLWFLDVAACPECGESNMRFYKAEVIEFIPHPGDRNNRGHGIPKLELTYPPFNFRPPCPPEVP